MSRLPLVSPREEALRLRAGGEAWRRLAGGVANLWRGSLQARFGLLVLAALLLVALFAPWIAPYDIDDQDLEQVLQGPSSTHWLGTDHLGRDLLSRLIFGAQVPLLVAFVSTALAALLGVSIGLAAGFLGGWLDAVAMRVCDAFLCFPPLLFTLVMAAHLGPGMHNVILSFVLFGWTVFARITRGSVLVVRELPFVEAAQAMGVSRWRQVTRHVLPNVTTPLIVACSIAAGSAIATEAGASFLGIGVQPPTPSWGKELQTGFTYLESVPWFSVSAGLLITLAICAFNFIGDGLRDRLDPRLR
ncbi:ABC transporter permease [Aquabacterium sp. A7-Y]|uniref:ABC transporter permease n=1 Tax=Aquabacterium sp. A7-Y TaxID=1349605 RepID=UPI00223DB424|nr:ABC transporter permease [Aquabacterium sp. A7-Y]MCW7536960.1 ABC transporter permease [Aquabacterium sp. A7-Y]